MKAKTVSKFKGLNLQSNSFGTDASFLEVAENIVIRYDDRIHKRRGFATFNQLNANHVGKAVVDFDNNILLITADCIYRFDTATTSFTGTTAAASTTITVNLNGHGLISGDYIAEVTCSEKLFKENFPNQEYDYSNSRVVTRINDNQFTFIADNNATGIIPGNMTAQFVKKLTGVAISSVSVNPYVTRANKNLYLTTDNGILKLTSSTAALAKAGLPQGLDIQGTLSGYSGVVQSNSITSYRVTFYTKDANNNLIIGAPSEQLMITNASIPVAASNIFGPDYVITAISYAPTTVTLSVIGANALVSPGDLIVVAGATNSGNDGTFTVATVNATQVTFVNPAGVTETPPSTCRMIHNIALITSTNHGLTNGDVIQIYDAITTGGSIADRTNFSIDSTVSTSTFRLVFTDRSITDLISFSFGYSRAPTLYFSVPAEIFTTSYGYEIYRTSASNSDAVLPTGDYKLVTSALFTAADITRGFILYDDAIPNEILGKELYTNNNTQEGELQANNRPPLAQDMTTYKNYTFYFNTKTYAYLELAVTVPSSIADNSTLTIGSTTYIFAKDSNNVKVGNELTDGTISVAGLTATITFNGHGLTNTSTIILVSNTQSIPNGSYVISNVAANTFDITIASGSGSGTCKFEGVKNALNQFYIKAYTDTSTVTVAESIDYTARSLVKAINRSGAFYAEYTSQFDGIPGLLRIEAIAFGTSFAATTSSLLSSIAFFPNIPLSGTTLSSSEDAFTNRLYFSKLSEPEAVPRLNYISIGSESAQGFRVIALRDSVIVMKSDGVFRVTGDSPNNFTAIVLDATATIKAAKSAVLLNNSVFMLSDQGVCSITESAVRIVSRAIEPLLNAVVSNSNLAANTAAVGYESDRYYVISTLDELGNRISYLYNFVTDSWTTSDKVFTNAIVAEFDDKIYYLNAAGDAVYRENKRQFRTDLTDEIYYQPVKTFIRATAMTMESSQEITVTTLHEHGLKAGDFITVRAIDASVGAVFTALTDPLYRRVITKIKNKTQFVYNADSIAALTIDGFIDYQRFLSEVPVDIELVSSSTTATITFPNGHGLANGNAIRVHNITTSLIANLVAESNLTGYRVASVIDSTTITVQLDAAATGDINSTGKVSDYNEKNFITLISTVLTPDKGDLLSDSINTIFKFNDVKEYAINTYVIKLHDGYTFLESDKLSLHGRIVSKLEFSQITFSGSLQMFSDFIIHVRGVHDCTYMNINFSCDSSNSSTITAWSSGVGSKKQVDDFSGFGRVSWGTYPFGGGTTRTLEYSTRAGAQIRTWVPKTASYGTFLKPKLEHVFGGELIDMAVVQVYYAPVSERVLK